MASNFAQMIAQQGLQNTAPRTDAAGAWLQGAQLALTKQQLDQARQKHQQDMQQLQFAKLEKLGNFLEAASKMPDGGAKQAFLKDYIPNYVNAVGLNDIINPTSLKMLQSDPTLGAYIKNEIREGRLDASQLYAALGDPAQLGQLIPDAAKFGSLEDLQTTVSSMIGDIDEAAKSATTESGKDRRAQMQITAAETARQTQMAEAQAREYRTFTANIGNRVRAEFKPIEDQKFALRTAVKSLEKVASDIAAGKRPSSIEFNAASRGLAKAFNSGSLSDADVADFRNLTGLDNITEDAINKWLTGNINRAAVESLLNIGRRSATYLDAKAQTLANAFEQQFSMYPDQIEQLRKRTGLTKFTQPTLPNKADNREAREAAPVNQRIADLDKPERLRALSAFIGDSLSRLNEVAARYGITPAQLQERLSTIQQGAN